MVYYQVTYRLTKIGTLIQMGYQIDTCIKSLISWQVELPSYVLITNSRNWQEEVTCGVLVYKKHLMNTLYRLKPLSTWKSVWFSGWIKKVCRLTVNYWKKEVEGFTPTSFKCYLIRFDLWIKLYQTPSSIVIY